LPSSTSAARSLHADILAMYRSGDAESARIRAAHLGAVLRLTPYTMAAHVGSAGLVVSVFWPRVPAALWAWLAVLAFTAGLTLLAWQRHRQRRPTTVSPRVVGRATVHATVLAAIWSAIPLFAFPGASTGQQMTIATLVTGMIGAGGFVLSPLPLASLSYIGVYALAALGALWRQGEPALAGVAALVGLYAPMVSIGSLSAWRKSTALLRSQEASARQEQMLSVLLQDFEHQAGEALWETGSDGHLKHLSPRLAELLGLNDGDIGERRFLAVLEGLGPEGALRLRQAMDSGRPFRALPLSVIRGDQLRHLHIHGKRLEGDDGRPLGWRGVLTDVTDKVDAERRLRHLAHTDSLTGLANRYTLRDQVAAAMEQGRGTALLLLDLDHFKAINDSLGHTAGDAVLRAVAMRLRAGLRPNDLVARLGGDEFAILMPQTDDAQDVPRWAQRLVDTLALPIEVESRRLRIGASVGVALCGDGAVGVDELLAQADLAVYAAKEAGGGRYVVYAPALGERSRRRLAIEEGLRVAIEQRRLSLHWQPKVDVAGWRIVGAEALMRWQHPELGRVNPAEFIAIAEQCGLIDELGRWALREACRAAAGPLAGLTVSVNVSPLQLRDGQFLAHVRAALREFPVDPAQLELEITESVFIGDSEAALAQLHALRALGVRVALDDFGTGYSSLAYLRRFPFDTLKIDRAFVSEILLRDDARAIVRMIAALATTLGMRTVCEGVETAAQLGAITDAGCHEVQGYLVSAPRPLDEFVAFRSGWGRERAHPQTLH